MDGCPLGLGLVVEDKPTEFSCTCTMYTVYYVQCTQYEYSVEALYTKLYSFIENQSIST